MLVKLKQLHLVQHVPLINLELNMTLTDNVKYVKLKVSNIISEEHAIIHQLSVIHMKNVLTDFALKC